MDYEPANGADTARIADLTRRLEATNRLQLQRLDAAEAMLSEMRSHLAELAAQLPSPPAH